MSGRWDFAVDGSLFVAVNLVAVVLLGLHRRRLMRGRISRWLNASLARRRRAGLADMALASVAFVFAAKGEMWPWRLFAAWFLVRMLDDLLNGGDDDWRRRWAAAKNRVRWRWLPDVAHPAT